MQLPVQHFTVTLWSVTFPLYAKIQADVPRLGRVFLHTVSITALLTVPVFCGMAAAPDIVIGGLFGEQWKPGSTIFQILCVGGPFLAMLRVFGAVSHARGYIFSECARQVIYLIFLVIALCLLFPFGLEGMATAVTLAGIARYLFLAHLAIRLAGVTWKQFFAAQVSGIVFGVAVAVPVHITAVAGTAVLESDVMRLLSVVAVSMASFFFSFLMVPTSWLGESFPLLIERFGPGLPPRLRDFITKKLSPARYCVIP